MTQELKTLLGPAAQRQGFLEAMRACLPAEHFERISRIFQLLDRLLSLLEEKNLSITRLRRLFFGPTTESARNVCGGKPASQEKKPRAKGHGRNSHRCYPGARRVLVSHPTLRHGQQCPACKRGRVRLQKKPALAISVTAQPPVGAVIHQMEQLRCDACDKVFTAPTPPEAGVEKYDPSVGVMGGLLRYGSGMPSYRLEGLQKSLGVPLPASVQWEQILRVARDLQPVFDHMVQHAAQASTLYSDDTTMRVAALRKEIQKEDKPERTGIFTSGILGEVDANRVNFFLTGRKHAGENLAAVLDHRQAQRPPPLHMCDGLGHNAPKGHETVACQCAVHARRKFVELEPYYPQECRQVVDCFAQIYRVEAQARDAGLDPEQRLRLHQLQSQPVMDNLAALLKGWIQDKNVEPNSPLGQAIAYTQVRWTKLTQFLRVPGAPIDNNPAERQLKMAILHRKNSLSYKTQRGADVGDLFMTLIQTCRTNSVNPFQYMMAVVANAASAKDHPARWTPWNYQSACSQTSAPPA